MSNIFSNIRRISLLFLCFVLFLSTNGCAQKQSASVSETKEPIKDQPLRDSTSKVITPAATGELLFENDTVSIDVSNTSDGYIILTYHGSNEKVKFQIAAPDEITYTYLISQYEEPIVFPLTGGNGTYTFSLLESVDAARDMYAIAFSTDSEVTITDEFLPFLTPNVYAFFDNSSISVKKGSELAQNCYSDLDVISNIYHYVTQSILYDEELAQNVAYGYIPNPDRTLESGRGICFDYASLMTSMLRSQRIPTKLEVGYVKEVYHAWISCYVAEIGWVDNIIQFDGENWSLLDPTLAANNNSSTVQEFIGDGSSYFVKYTY